MADRLEVTKNDGYPSKNVERGVRFTKKLKRILVHQGGYLF
jgi:hypothetical protein